MPADSPAPDCTAPQSCTTRQLADAAGVTLGTTVTGEYLDESDYRATLIDTFNSITPENELKWAAVQPERGEWDFGPADQIVDFALDHDMAIKGHNLLWDQDLVDSTPDWVLQIDDPDELRGVVTDHISTVMTRYRDSVDRWDVVNEPLETLGAELYDNHFRQVLGDDYLAEVFTIAEAAAPGESLWLNEAAVEFQPAKAAALVTLVRDLVDAGCRSTGSGCRATWWVAGSMLSRWNSWSRTWRRSGSRWRSPSWTCRPTTRSTRSGCRPRPIAMRWVPASPSGVVR